MEPCCAVASGTVAAQRHRLRPATLLLVAWALVGTATTMGNGAYLPHAVALLIVGLALIGAAVTRMTGSRPPASGPAAAPGLLAAAVAALLLAFVFEPGIYARGSLLTPSRELTLAAAGLALVAVLAGDRLAWACAGLAVAASSAASVLMVKASPSPRIDVWFILTNGAQDVVRRVDMYRDCWPGNTDRLTDCVYPYLPMTSVAQVPFRYLGDIRYSYVVALLVCVAAMLGLAGRRALPVAALLLVSPKLTFLVEQSWTEPLLLAGVATFVWAAASGRRTTAVLALAFALACKQHVLLVLPLAALWPAFGWRRTAASLGVAGLVTAPWFLADPRAFLADAWDFNLHLPPRGDSLSLFTTATRHGLTLPFSVVGIVTLAALAVALLVLPRTAAGFSLGAAFVQYVFDLSNKQSFFNHWWLVSGLLLLAVTCLLAEDSDPSEERSAAPVGARSDVVGEEPGRQL